MPISGKFLGDTKGNKDQNHNLSEQGKGADITGELGGEGESHPGGIGGQFLGASSGNSYLNPDRSSDVSTNPSPNPGGSKGEAHSFSASSKFIGQTKGNTDVPPDRTAGAPDTGYGGGVHKKGGLPHKQNTAGHP